MGLFGRGRFGLETFRSDHEILHVNFLMQTYLNQRKVLFKNTSNMIQDPIVNRGAMAHSGYPLQSPLCITPA